jgi:hypothetical protein
MSRRVQTGTVDDVRENSDVGGGDALVYECPLAGHSRGSKCVRVTIDDSLAKHRHRVCGTVWDILVRIDE